MPVSQFGVQVSLSDPIDCVHPRVQERHTFFRIFHCKFIRGESYSPPHKTLSVTVSHVPSRVVRHPDTKYVIHRPVKLCWFVFHRLQQL